MSRSRRCGAQHRVGGVSPFFYFEKSKLIEPVDQKAVFFNQGGIVGGMTVGNRDGGENPKKVDQHRHKYHIKSPRWEINSLGRIKSVHPALVVMVEVVVCLCWGAFYFN